MGCALQGLLLSGFSFSNTNYDNWNSNTNVSSHLCKKLAAQTLPTWQKTTTKEGASVLKAKTTRTKQSNETIE
jgi:hypothetical protein